MNIFPAMPDDVHKISPGSQKMLIMHDFQMKSQVWKVEIKFTSGGISWLLQSEKRNLSSASWW